MQPKTFIEIVGGYPITNNLAETEISFWIDSANVLIVHSKAKGFLKPTELQKEPWYKKLKGATLPQNHRFYAEVLNNKLKVYMIEDLKNGTIYNWYDMAWLCCDSRVNLDIVPRERCPKDTQYGRAKVREYVKHMPTPTGDRKESMVSVSARQVCET